MEVRITAHHRNLRYHYRYQSRGSLVSPAGLAFQYLTRPCLLSQRLTNSSVNLTVEA